MKACIHCGEQFVSDFNLSNHTRNSHPGLGDIARVLCRSTHAAYGGVTVVCCQPVKHAGQCRTNEPGFKSLRWDKTPPTTVANDPSSRVWGSGSGTWCNEKFGPHPRGYIIGGDPRTKDETLYYQCRLPKDHDGDHNCPASVEAGRTQPPASPVPPDLKPRPRSAAARAIFGG
jgi:hypothetical protein